MENKETQLEELKSKIIILEDQIEELKNEKDYYMSRVLDLKSQIIVERSMGFERNI